MTRRPRIACDKTQLAALVEAGCEVACIVGKTWTLHVHEALRVPLEENIPWWRSVEWLRARGPAGLLDAEHFFQGTPTTRLCPVGRRGRRGSGGRGGRLCDTNGDPPDDVERLCARW